MSRPSIQLSSSDLAHAGEHVSRDDPDWMTVGSCIRRLDGKRFTEVYLSDGDASGLMITGGAHGRLMVERVSPDANWLLIDSAKPENPCMEILDGGPKDFPASYIVDCETALRAAKMFYETGEMEQSLTWIE